MEKESNMKYTALSKAVELLEEEFNHKQGK